MPDNVSHMLRKGNVRQSTRDSLRLLPTTRAVELQRSEIRTRFGVSRATVARRFKEGLAAGVFLAEGRVVEHAQVRRGRTSPL